MTGRPSYLDDCVCDTYGVDACPTCKPFEDKGVRPGSDLTPIGAVIPSVGVCTPDRHAYPELVRTLTRAGKSLLWRRCGACGQKLSSYLPHEGVDVDAVPVVEDLSVDVPPCRRCGKRGTELHHWAPSSLFADADLWPQDWLCPDCHTEWHRTVAGGRLA